MRVLDGIQKEIDGYYIRREMCIASPEMFFAIKIARVQEAASWKIKRYIRARRYCAPVVTRRVALLRVGVIIRKKCNEAVVGIESFVEVC